MQISSWLSMTLAKKVESGNRIMNMFCVVTLGGTCCLWGLGPADLWIWHESEPINITPSATLLWRGALARCRRRRWKTIHAHGGLSKIRHGLACSLWMKLPNNIFYFIK